MCIRDRPITAEDYQTLDRMVANVEGRIVAQRAQEYEVVRKQRSELRKRVPEAAWQQPLDVLDLPGRIHNLLLDTNVNTVGDLIYILEMGDDYFLKLRGLGEKALETVKDTLSAYQSAQIDAVAAAEAGEIDQEAEAEAIETIAPSDEQAEVEEELGVEELPVIERIVQTEDMVTAVPDIILPEEEGEVSFDDETLDRMEIAGVLDLADVEPEVEDTLTPIDDLSASIFVEEVKPPKPEPKKKPPVVVVRPVVTEESAEEEAKRKTVSYTHLDVYKRQVGSPVRLKRKVKGPSKKPTSVVLAQPSVG